MFWTRIRHAHYDEWRLVEGEDASGVPEKSWKAFNKAFWDWKGKGLLAPLDELDAYQFAAGEMIKAAGRLPALTAAETSTYLIAAAYRSLLKYRVRQVQRVRDEYRATCETVDAPSVRDFAEALPGLHSYDGVAAMRLAAECVRETLAKLDADAQRGLRAWLAADGVWVDAAKLYNEKGSVQGYTYRFKALWAPAFRRVCEWSWNGEWKK